MLFGEEPPETLLGIVDESTQVNEPLECHKRHAVLMSKKALNARAKYNHCRRLNRRQQRLADRDAKLVCSRCQVMNLAWKDEAENRIAELFEVRAPTSRTTLVLHCSERSPVYDYELRISIP